MGTWSMMAGKLTYSVRSTLIKASKHLQHSVLKESKVRLQTRKNKKSFGYKKQSNTGQSRLIRPSKKYLLMTMMPMISPQMVAKS